MVTLQETKGVPGTSICTHKGFLSHKGTITTGITGLLHKIVLGHMLRTCSKQNSGRKVTRASVCGDAMVDYVTQTTEKVTDSPFCVSAPNVNKPSSFTIRFYPPARRE